MRVGWGSVFAVPLLVCSLASSVAETNQLNDLKARDREIIRLYEAGKYAEAVLLARDTVALAESTLAPDHSELATALNSLALLYAAQGHYADAEPLYKRSLAIDEVVLGREHSDANYFAVARSLTNLGGLLAAQGRHSEALLLHTRSLAIWETVLGPDNNYVALALNNLAEVYRDQGRYAEAAPIYERSLAIREKIFGPDDAAVATALGSLGELYTAEGRYTDAEPLYKRSLAIREKVLGPSHPGVSTVLGSLSELYRVQGRYGDAEPLYKRSLEIKENVLGPEHPDVALSLNNLALLYVAQGRYTDAEPLYTRGLGILTKALGSDHPDVARAVGNLAELYAAQSRYGDAELLYKRSLEIAETALGPDHPIVAGNLNGLAALYAALKRPADAEPYFTRSLAIAQRTLGPDHPDLAVSYNNLAVLALTRRDWGRASDYWRKSVGVIKRRAERGLAGSKRETNEAEASRKRGYFLGLVKVTHRIATEERGHKPKLAEEMFETTQWGQASEAASSIAKMAARSAKGNLALAVSVRERQDIVGEWQVKDKTLIAAKSEPPGKRNTASEIALADRLAAIDQRLAEIDARLAKEFPDYVALTNPKPLSLIEVRAQLHSNEALVVFLDTDDSLKPLPQETFIWVVTKTDSRWLRSDVGVNALTGRIGALRCGLDSGAWDGDGLARCNSLFGFRPQSKPPDTLPFDLSAAYALYKDLFGDAEDLIKDKHLLIVPSGPLTQFPFHVLVTDAPKTPDDYANAAWLATRHAITVLPSVASLAALRRNAKPSAAPEPFIGFGDPVLVGQTGCGGTVVPDQCPGAEIKVAGKPSLLHRASAALGALPAYFRNGQADVVEVRKLCALPETAYELKCVARSLDTPESNILLGKNMTEAALKNARLDRYRVVHFATHGLLAGETAQIASDMAEPALVFTPPDTPTENDDGLLTASEVAALKLDADWVVMSACNTAGGGAPGAEALSGLARAFFYAGARALLVSHWPVNSYAATMLTSRTFAEMGKDPSLGRSEAFRRAMLALMSDATRPWAAHPSVWAPFVVVGEGGKRGPL